MNEVEPFDTSKLFKDFRGLWVLNKSYCRTEKRNVTERLPLPEGIFINDWSKNEEIENLESEVRE